MVVDFEPWESLLLHHSDNLGWKPFRALRLPYDCISGIHRPPDFRVSFYEGNDLIGLVLIIDCFRNKDDTIRELLTTVFIGCEGAIEPLDVCLDVPR